MSATAGEIKPPAVGDRVKVVQQSAPVVIKQRRYQVIKVNSKYDLLQLEWIDGSLASKDRYLWVLADYVRPA